MTENQNSKQIEWPLSIEYVLEMFWSLEFGIFKLFGIWALWFGILMPYLRKQIILPESVRADFDIALITGPDQASISRFWMAKRDSSALFRKFSFFSNRDR